LSVEDAKMYESAIVLDGRVLRTSDNKDFDNIIIIDVAMGGVSLMNNSVVAREQEDQLCSYYTLLPLRHMHPIDSI